MKKVLGILGVLLVVCGLTWWLGEGFTSARNVENLMYRSALFGIISIGAGIVIMSGGIDLSIGSVVCLCGCLTPWLLVDHGWPVAAVVAVVIGLGLVIGLFHGLLVTWGLQPFIVTLCGLLMYRGLARIITNDQTMGFQGRFEDLQSLGKGRLPVPFVEGFAIPAPFIFLLAVAVATGVLLRFTIWGRYLLAVGRNEEAARYSGVPTARVKVGAYVACGVLSALGGLLFMCKVGSGQPVDFGNFFELYAIAAAVLGGCSLRGGEGTIIGVMLGAATMQVLRNAINLIDEVHVLWWTIKVPDNAEYFVIGAVLLLGVTVDELIKRLVGRRRAARATGESP